MRRAVIVVIALLVGACTGGGSSTDDASSSTTSVDQQSPDDLPALEALEAPPWEPETRSEELAAEIGSTGGLTRQQAVDVIGLMLTDLPGVTPSDLPSGDGLGDTYTMMVADQYHDLLTREQQVVLDDFLDSATDVVDIGWQGAVAASDDGAGDPGTSTSTTTAPGPHGLRRFGAGVAAGPDPAVMKQYQLLMTEARDAWNAYLPNHPTPKLQLAFVDGKAGMVAVRTSTNPLTCQVRVFSSYVDAKHPADYIRFYFAHEIFHCFEYAWTPGDWNVNPWIVEGAADWAAADLYRTTPVDYSTGGLLWLNWFTQPAKPLHARAYDAWPLYEDAHLAGLDVYGIVQSQFAHPETGVSPSLAAMGLDGVVFRMNWSSRTLRDDQFDPEWRLPWPGLSPGFGPHDNAFDLGPRGVGVYPVIGSADYSQRQLTVDMTGDVGLVTVTPHGGPFSTMTALGTKTIADGGSRTFCFSSDECRCPGDPARGTPMLGPTMVFSFAAASTATTAIVRAEPWDPDDCDGGGAGVGSDISDHDDGSSNGDPHLTTFDGLSYDVMTLGEFVLARDPGGDLEVQARHLPVGTGAGTSAVAIGTGAHRITFTQPDLDVDGPPTVRVDGEPVALGVFDVGDVRVDAGSMLASLTWPDGSTVALRWIHGWFVGVSLPHDRAADIEGLLGAADGNMRNDLVLADGTTVDTSAADDDESPYVLGWAVDDTTSLFDYGPGESAATFRTPHPVPIPTPIPEDDYDRCRAALGDQATAFEVSSCAFDVTVTGDDDFVSVYADVVDERVAAHPPVVIPRGTGEPSATTSTAPPATGQAGTPTLTLGADRPSGVVEATAGTVLVARAGGCPGDDVAIEVSVVGDESALARAALCDPSGLTGIGADVDDERIDGEAYVWLPGDQVYEVSVQTVRADTEVPDVDVYVDPTPTVVDAAATAAGGVWLLDGIADTVVFLPDPSAAFETTGLLEACAIQVYWTGTFPRSEPLDLTRCDHVERLDFPASGNVIPVVVFARTSDPVEVSLTPM